MRDTLGITSYNEHPTAETVADLGIGSLTSKIVGQFVVDVVYFFSYPEATQIHIALSHQMRDGPIISGSNFSRRMCLCFGHSSQTIAPLTHSFCQRNQHARGEMLNDSLHFPKESTSGRRNRDYTGMWVRLGSTDLMAGKVMFLRSNQGYRLDGNVSVADSFRSDLVGFKGWSGRILGAFLPSCVCQKRPPVGKRTR
ncbi:hypothetical protein TNCV_1801521 [Trichonephila clavipes]|nr:hypothetical protein TNCV_1801521 [Trichonephila clavipes]